MTKEELLTQFDILRTEYIKAINDKDVLINWGKPQLEALYNTRLGVHQIELLQIQLRVKSLKRKVEIVRSIIVRNMPLDVDAIELSVATELAETELQIMSQLADIENSKQLLTNLNSPTRSAELRNLFRQLAKQLHPDVIGELTSEQEQLWNLVKNAYNAGDVEKLKALQVAYEKELTQSQTSIEQLSEQDIELKNETLKEGIKLLHTEILAIKNSFPFDVEDKIKDEAWVKQEVEIIDTQVKALRSFEGELILEYEALINNYGGNKPEFN
jgi:hypothetical protein